MARQRVSDEVKAAALADLQTGEQPAVVAQRYGLNRDTVNKWKQRMSTDVSAPLSTDVSVSTPPIVRPTIQNQQIELQQLVIDNLKAKLVATQRIAEHATNPAWLNNQSASELATLFGVLDQSAIGILDRLAGRAAPDDTAPDRSSA